MSKIKLYIYLGIFAIIILLGITACVLYSQVNKYKNLYNRELQNVEAYQIDNSNLKGEVRQYQMTIDELYTSKDSLDVKLMATMKKLKISDKKVKDLQYQLTHATRVDTIILSDTVFVEDTHIDTTFGDEWYKMGLKLDYPSTIVTAPEFTSEQYVYVYKTEVYNSKPSCLFFIRWFQKKHTVVEVKVEEKSPYIKTIKQKFIEINN